jgi:DNA-binding LytR/AlgR family response regulator
MNTDTAPAAAAVRAVIADDERLMREQLRARLAEVWPDLQIVAEAKNGLEAVELVQQHRPDLVFLDIRMPGLTGVDAARQIAQMEIGEDESLPEIVFITAYDQYAVEAFEQGVADYVLKPAERERLQLTVQRIKQRLARRGTPEADTAPPMQQLLHRLASQLNPNASPRYLEWIQATVGQSIQMIPVAEVLFFISDEKYTRVQTASVEALSSSGRSTARPWSTSRPSRASAATSAAARSWRSRATPRSWKSAAATRTCSRACRRSDAARP